MTSNMHLPFVWGLLESSIDSLSCWMNSLPYTLLSCQMFSNRSKGFLQPSSASLFKDREIITLQLINTPYVFREHLPNWQLHPLHYVNIWRESCSCCLRQTVQNILGPIFPFIWPKDGLEVSHHSHLKVRAEKLWKKKLAIIQNLQ